MLTVPDMLRINTGIRRWAMAMGEVHLDGAALGGRNHNEESHVMLLEISSDASHSPQSLTGWSEKSHIMGLATLLLLSIQLILLRQKHLCHPERSERSHTLAQL
jgi:hypothetical protein